MRKKGTTSETIDRAERTTQLRQTPAEPFSWLAPCSPQEPGLKPPHRWLLRQKAVNRLQHDGEKSPSSTPQPKSIPQEEPMPPKPYRGCARSPASRNSR